MKQKNFIENNYYTVCGVSIGYKENENCSLFLLLNCFNFVYLLYNNKFYNKKIK